jgi:hypothetical protein
MRWLFATAALLGCGGSTADLGQDASAADGFAEASSADGPGDSSAGDAVPTCPPGTPPIPIAAIYACDAGAAPDAGCHAAAGDPNASRDPNLYPLGCVVTLPTKAGFCGGDCCGPQTCNCERGPSGTGLQFLCPL